MVLRLSISQVVDRASFAFPQNLNSTAKLIARATDPQLLLKIAQQVDDNVIHTAIGARLAELSRTPTREFDLVEQLHWLKFPFVWLEICEGTSDPVVHEREINGKLVAELKKDLFSSHGDERYTSAYFELLARSPICDVVLLDYLFAGVKDPGPLFHQDVLTKLQVTLLLLPTNGGVDISTQNSAIALLEKLAAAVQSRNMLVSIVDQTLLIAGSSNIVEVRNPICAIFQNEHFLFEDVEKVLDSLSEVNPLDEMEIAYYIRKAIMKANCFTDSQIDQKAQAVGILLDQIDKISNPKIKDDLLADVIKTAPKFETFFDRLFPVVHDLHIGYQSKAFDAFILRFTEASQAEMLLQTVDPTRRTQVDEFTLSRLARSGNIDSDVAWRATMILDERRGNPFRHFMDALEGSPSSEELSKALTNISHFGRYQDFTLLQKKAIVEKILAAEALTPQILLQAVVEIDYKESALSQLGRESLVARIVEIVFEEKSRGANGPDTRVLSEAEFAVCLEISGNYNSGTNVIEKMLDKLSQFHLPRGGGKALKAKLEGRKTATPKIRKKLDELLRAHEILAGVAARI